VLVHRIDFTSVPLPFLAALVMVRFFESLLFLQNVNYLLHLDSLKILYQLVIQKILRISVHIEHLLTRSEHQCLKLLKLVLRLYRHRRTADACG
jgi:hypothetical protein